MVSEGWTIATMVVLGLGIGCLFVVVRETLGVKT